MQIMCVQVLPKDQMQGTAVWRLQRLNDWLQGINPGRHNWKARMTAKLKCRSCGCGFEADFTSVMLVHCPKCFSDRVEFKQLSTLHSEV